MLYVYIIKNVKIINYYYTYSYIYLHSSGFDQSDYEGQQ